jgi:hypothetical protein
MDCVLWTPFDVLPYSATMAGTSGPALSGGYVKTVYSPSHPPSSPSRINIEIFRHEWISQSPHQISRRQGIQVASNSRSTSSIFLADKYESSLPLSVVEETKPPMPQSHFHIRSCFRSNDDRRTRLPPEVFREPRIFSFAGLPRCLGNSLHF